MAKQLTPASQALFNALAEDSPNWSGTPPTDGNVGMSKEGRGNLTQLKRAGLVTTFSDEGVTWVCFTDKGVALARQQGFQMSDY